jgi:DNA-binding protein
MEIPISVIDICGKRTIEYVFEAISYFNNNFKEIRLRAFGCNINKGVEVAKILEESIDIEVEKSSLGSVKLNGVNIPYLDIPIRFDSNGNHVESYGDGNPEKISDHFNEGYIDYPTYHLLLDWHLRKNKQILIKESKGGELLTLFFDQGEIKYQKRFFDYKDENKRKISSRIDEALCRSGAVMPSNWKEIAAKLSTHDDVILGIDTNILYNCTVSEHLLPAVSMIELTEFVHTPNWILLVIPATVMYELEEAANIRHKDNNLKNEGRFAFRALQEIIELSDNIDIPGVSLLIVGEADAGLDNKTSLKRINENVYNLGMTLNDFKSILSKSGYENQVDHNTGNFKGSPPRKSSSGDMTIRNQFKKFLRQIDFHKGTYFLTSDKSNAALAMAEGLNPILIGNPQIKINKRNTPMKLKTENKGHGKEINFGIQTGKVIYELAVSFGSIEVGLGNKTVSLCADQKGKNMEHWVHKHLQIKKGELEKMVKNYHGKFSLKYCHQIWQKLIDKFEDIDWMPGSKYCCFK